LDCVLKARAFRRAGETSKAALAAEVNTVRPRREHATSNGQTYFVTSRTAESRELFRKEEWAKLFVDVLYHYRGDAYDLHGFVVMPDHFHVLITPKTSLEKAAQFIKGGFSFRAKKELGTKLEIWQRGFSNHRIRDVQDYGIHRKYILNNPVKKHLCANADRYPYSSAFPGYVLDGEPRRQ
jgi:putative transposase